MPILDFSVTSIGNKWGAWKQRITRDKLVLNGIYIFGNAIVTSFAGVLFWNFASRLYSSTQIGIASSVLSIIQLLIFIGSLGLGIGMIRFLFEDDSPIDLFTSILLLSVLAVFILGFCYLFIVPVVSPSLADEVVGLYPGAGFLVVLLLGAVFSVLGSLFIAARKARYSFLQVIIMNGTRLVMIYYLVNLGVWGIIGALTLGYLIAIILSLKFYLPNTLPKYKFRMRINWTKIRHIFSFAIGNYLANVFRQMPISLYPSITLELLGKSSSAYVYIVYMVASFVSGPGLALGNSALVESVHFPENYKKFIQRASYLAISVTLVLAGICYVFAESLLGLFGEGYFENAGGLFLVLLIASPFVAGNMVLVNYLRTRKYIKELVTSSLILAIVALSIPIGLMKTIGIIAIGYGWITAQIVVITFVLIAILVRGKHDK